jgi:hypothetical protein
MLDTRHYHWVATKHAHVWYSWTCYVLDDGVKLEIYTYSDKGGSVVDKKRTSGSCIKLSMLLGLLGSRLL